MSLPTLSQTNVRNEWDDARLDLHSKTAGAKAVIQAEILPTCLDGIKIEYFIAIE